MHAVGLHSALAIKRQRKRRDEQQRARERRYSSQSGDSVLTSPRLSTTSFERHSQKKKYQERKTRIQKTVDSKIVTSIGLLHIGVVFLVLGGFLLISGILPGDINSIETKFSIRWWNELVVIGILFIMIGFALIISNRIIARKEENDLEEYVKRQLTRSRSGHRLERDSETGELKTKQAKRVKNINNSGSIDSTEQETPNILFKNKPQKSLIPSIQSCSTLQTKFVLERTDVRDSLCNNYNNSGINNCSSSLLVNEPTPRSNTAKNDSYQVALPNTFYD